ncbi:MAG: hypothetical protein VX871_05830 [Pseudomonadota bacterium]|nr:hypothetical protein [Pseudomonadota bacterium]
MTMEEHIAAGPQWVQHWIQWMTVVNMAAVLFLLRWKDGRIRWGYVEALVSLLTLVPIVVVMTWLFNSYGYVRLLGLAHVLFWTPLAIWLWTRLSRHPLKSVFGVYLRVLLATIVISLAFDYADVARHLMGDTKYS